MAGWTRKRVVRSHWSCLLRHVGRLSRSGGRKTARSQAYCRPFHVMKNLNEALSKARRVIQKDADEANKTDIKKVVAGYWSRTRKTWKAEERQKLQHMLGASAELKACYEFKEAFRDLFNQRLGFMKTPKNIYSLGVARVEASEFKALQSFVKTLRNWWQQILNYFVGRHNNGFAEGVNLKIKMLNRRRLWLS